jgi:hypothetical protein
MSIEQAMREAEVALKNLEKSITAEYLAIGQIRGELNAQYEIRKIYFSCLSLGNFGRLRRRALEVFFAFWVFQKPPEINQRLTRKRPSLISLPKK